MQTSSLTMFGTILEMIRSICKCSRSSNLPVNPYCPVYVCNVPTKNDMNVQGRALRTWPSEQLGETLKKILDTNGMEMESEQFNSLLTKVSEELNEKCSYNLGDQYDFCIICASDDYGEAVTFQRDIESRLKLIGYNASEAVSLGRDHFQVYEECVERSSKVIFYITENFTNDEVCCHLARNTFVAPSEETKNKCIPIVDDSTTKLPDSMMLVEKLVKSNNYHIDLRLGNIFNNSVRQEKDNRFIKLKADLDSKRMELLQSILVDYNIFVSK